VIASAITKSDLSDPDEASDTYRGILSSFEHKDENVCSPDNISIVTELIRQFLRGHAGSLLSGVPLRLTLIEAQMKKGDLGGTGEG